MTRRARSAALAATTGLLVLASAAPALAAYPDRSTTTDSFNRNGTSSLGPNWAATSLPGATGTPVLGNLRVQFPAGALSTAHWAPLQFGGLQEASVKKTSAGQIGVTACVRNPGPTASGYSLLADGTGALTLKRYTAGVATTLYAADATGGTVATNAAIGIAVTASGVQAWIGSGSTWTLAKTVADPAAASCSGSIGLIGQGASGDDFKGGGLPYGTGPTPVLPQRPAQAASQFVSGIGVNTHFRYTSGPYCTAIAAQTARERLTELGVDDVREELTSWAASNDCALRDRYRSLVTDGFGIDLVTHVLTAWQDLSDGYTRLDAAGAENDVLDVAQLINEHPKPAPAGSEPGAGLIAVEGPNEFDGKERTAYLGFGDRNAFGSYWMPWRDKIQTFQPQVRTRTKARPGLANTPVVLSSFASGGVTNYAPTNSYKAYAQVGNRAGTFDRNNVHFYSNRKAPESTWPLWKTDADAVAANPAIPLDATEVGWNTGTSSVGVSQTAAATYTTRAMLLLASEGVSRQYLYELADMGNDPADPQHRWGLLNQDLTRKPAFHAVKRLLAALEDGDADGATVATPAPLAVSIDGGAASIRSHVLAKADGSYVLALWRPDAVTDETTGADVAVPAASVALTFGRSYARSVLRPADGSTAAAVWPQATAATTGATGTVAVGADPVLVKLVAAP